MRVNAQDINEAASALEFDTPAEHFPILREMARSGECGFETPIRTRLRAVRIGEMIEVEGRTTAAVRYTCGRCLAPFVAALTASVALTYVQRAAAHPKTDRPDAGEMPPEEDDLIYFQGDDIDLTPGVQEQVILAMPLRPLCSERCRGLCARCGADLNLAACSCSEGASGGPFDVLSRLRLDRK